MYDEESREPITEPDTDNATKFHPTEAPDDKQQKFNRFHLYNSGVSNGKWVNRELQRERDNFALYDAVSSQIELTDYQKRRGREVFDNLKLNEIGVSATTVAFCVCAIVVREDGRVYHPQRSDGNNDALFVEYESELPCTTRQLHSIYNRVWEVVNG